MKAYFSTHLCTFAHTYPQCIEKRIQKITLNVDILVDYSLEVWVSFMLKVIFFYRFVYTNIVHFEKRKKQSNVYKLLFALPDVAGERLLIYDRQGVRISS